MIERYLKLHQLVNHLIKNSSSRRVCKAVKYLLDVSDIELCQSILKVLTPIKSMTLMLSHSKLTSSRVLPTLCYLKKKLKRDETDSEQLIQIKLLLSACLNF